MGNLDDPRRLVRDLAARDVAVEFVQEQLTFSGDDSPMATLVLSLMGAFAEFERSLSSVSGSARASRWPRRMEAQGGAGPRN